MSVIYACLIKYSFPLFAETGSLGLLVPCHRCHPLRFAAFPSLREIEILTCSVLEQLASKQINFLRLKEHDAICFSLKLSENEIFIEQSLHSKIT